MVPLEYRYHLARSLIQNDIEPEYLSPIAFQVLHCFELLRKIHEARAVPTTIEKPSARMSIINELTSVGPVVA